MPGTVTNIPEIINFTISSVSWEIKVIQAPPKADVKKAAANSALCSLACECKEAIAVGRKNEAHGTQVHMQIAKREKKTHGTRKRREQ